MTVTRCIHNSYPCCNKASGIHHDHWPDGHVMERQCPKCKTWWIVEFQAARPHPRMGLFRYLKWTRKESTDA